MNIDYLTFKSNRRFGVEFEVNRQITQQGLVEAVRAAIPKVQCHIEGWHYDCNNAGWVVKTDSSCGDQGNKHLDGGGYEIVSCVGSGIEHLLNIERVAESLSKAGAITNNHCGFHCHVEINDLEAVNAATLLAYWCKIEPLMGNIVPKHRLRSKHCKFFTKHRTKFPAVVAISDPLRFWELMKLRTLGPEAKRTTLTLVNYQRTKFPDGSFGAFNRPTVELRLPEGTVNPFDVKNWVRLFIHFVDTCSFKHFPCGIQAANFKESLEILGLLTPDSDVSVLSPGLFETKIWLLNRLYTYASTSQLRKEVFDYYTKIAMPDMEWNFPLLKLHNDFLAESKEAEKIKQSKLQKKNARIPVNRTEDYIPWSVRVAGNSLEGRYNKKFRQSVLEEYSKKDGRVLSESLKSFLEKHSNKSSEQAPATGSFAERMAKWRKSFEDSPIMLDSLQWDESL